MKSKELKRIEAERRNAEYAKLSTKEKLAQLDRACLTAKRQRAKLAKLLEASNNV